VFGAECYQEDQRSDYCVPRLVDEFKFRIDVDRNWNQRCGAINLPGYSHPCWTVSASSNILSSPRKYVHLSSVHHPSNTYFFLEGQWLRNFSLGRFRDSLTILTVSGLVVWLILNDLQSALHSLQTQIGRLKESQENLTYLSQHDLLTGLPNRSLGRERIERAIALAERNRTSVAVMFVDLDYFKSINDSLGHAAGDDFLKQVAQRLRSALRQSDIVSRHGGDEFVLALIDPADQAGVSTAATALLESLKKVVTVKDTEVSISCSIGVALYPHDGHDYETLLRHADIAMYQAKESGRNAMCFFDADMRTSAEHDMYLMTGMRAALSRSEFVLHFQPVFNLADGSLLGAEALVRWMHPEQGLIAPAEFISTAEKQALLWSWVRGFWEKPVCRQSDGDKKDPVTL